MHISILQNHNDEAKLHHHQHLHEVLKHDQGVQKTKNPLHCVDDHKEATDGSIVQ